MEIICLPFQELTLDQLYAIMQLRQEVFVVEQDCPYLDADGKDQNSYHLMIWDENNLAAYTRLVPKGISYEQYVSIGRVVNQKDYRGKGIGKTLMEASISWCQKLFPKEDIKISAQCYLEKFYTALGFIDIDKKYLEDGIPHMAMVWKAENE